jgi:solute carrier family 35 protein E3
VNLSTFLVIGATSSLTYNVVGHVKTVIILTGGVIFFGDSMPLKKLGGIAVAMAGIIMYSSAKLQEARNTLPTKINVRAPPEMVNGGDANMDVTHRSPRLRRVSATGEDSR